MLKQSTIRNLAVFMTDSADHVTGKTGLTLTITASKDGAAFGSITPVVTELATGWYSLALTTTHTNTLGDFLLHITGTGADPSDIREQVVLDLPGVAQTGDNFARLGAPAGASVSADIAATKALLPTALAADGSIKASVQSFLGTAFTEGAAGRIAAAFKQFFNIASPAATMDHGVLVDTVTTATTATNLTNAPTAGDLTAAMKTSVTTAATAATPTAAAVTGNVGGNVTGSVGSVAAGGIAAASFAAGAINAAAIAADAITDAKVAADVTIASVTGAVGSVTGAVGSVTGNVGGNVVGSVASVTARVTANTDQLAGQTVAAAAGVTFPTSVASPTNITAGTITTATNLTNAPTAGDFTAAMKTSLNAATPAVTVSDKTGFSLSSGGVQAIWDALTSALTTSGSIGKWIVDKLDVVLSTRLATSGYTAPLDAAGTRSAVGLVSANLDTQLNAIAGYIDTEVGSIKGVTDKLDTALELDGAVYRYTTNALEQAPTGGAAPTAVAIADEVQTRTISAVTSVTNNVGITQAAADKVWVSATRTLSSFGTLVADVATAVWSAVARTLTAGTNIVLAKGVGVTGFNDLSAAQVNTEADTALADVGLTTTVTGRIDAATSTRLATAGYTAPDNAGIASAASDAATAVAGAAAIFARTDVATSTRLPTSGYTAPDNASIAAILDDTGTSGVQVADKTGYRLSSAGVDDLLRTVLTEGYAAQGAAFTLEQALFMLWSLLAERGILATTLTSGKLDHTAAMTFTLDDAVTPTAQERAT